MLRVIRTLLATAAVFIAAVVVRADITAKDALRTMPDSILEPLTQKVLSDLTAYYEASQREKTMENSLGGEAKILTLEASHALIRTGTARTLTFDILTTKSDTVYAVIETFETPVKDSRLTIYNKKWEPQLKLWKEPKSKDWLNPYGRKHRSAFEQDVPYILAEYAFDSETGILTLTNRSKENDYMLAQLRYQWTPKGFKFIKDD